MAIDPLALENLRKFEMSLHLSLFHLLQIISFCSHQELCDLDLSVCDSPVRHPAVADFLKILVNDVFAPTVCVARVNVFGVGVLDEDLIVFGEGFGGHIASGLEVE
jgi:hypothetical protein